MKRKGSSGRGAVLITGCSSGIGHATAHHLARQGYVVFATVRKEADLGLVSDRALPNLVGICPLDMTNEEQIRAAAARVKDELSSRSIGLRAVVNNAGGGRPAPIELLDAETMRQETLARIVGPMILVQETLPLLRRDAGRLVWIVTPAIIPTPYVASIHACDFAANCLARTLDIELQRWSIPSIMIRCGGIRTRAGMRTVEDVDQLLASADADRAALYDDALRGWADEMRAFDARRTEPERVAETVGRALSAPRPRRRYRVGHMSLAAALLEALPQPMVDRVLRSRF